MINWNNVFKTPINVDIFKSFARGTLPKNDLLSILAHSDISSEIRGVIRKRGTKRVRDAAHRALSRRGL